MPRVHQHSSSEHGGRQAGDRHCSKSFFHYLGEKNIKSENKHREKIGLKITAYLWGVTDTNGP